MKQQLALLRGCKLPNADVILMGAYYPYDPERLQYINHMKNTPSAPAPEPHICSLPSAASTIFTFNKPRQ
eukprot:scaffold9352_cov35-Prasinocladus_malaysianus.AAC.1